MGCDENGIIQGVKASVVSDTGAFASLGGPVLERACTHAAGPYAYENFEIEGRAYYTNNPPAGALPGLRRDPDLLLHGDAAQRDGGPGGHLPVGDSLSQRHPARAASCRTARSWTTPPAWWRRWRPSSPPMTRPFSSGDPVGIACAMKNAGVGVGIPDWGRCKLIVEDDGKVHIYSGASCIGQGLGTVLVQVVVTNTRPTRGTTSSMSAATPGSPRIPAIPPAPARRWSPARPRRRACEKLNAALEGKTLGDLVGQEFYGEYLAKTDPLGADVPNPVSHVAYGYATQMCVLDKKTGRIKKMVAAHDVGKAVNPLSCEGQIEGGVVMSMGYALTEQYPIDDTCKPTAKYGTLGLFRANQIPPEIQAIVVEKPGLNVAGGAIGIGEITSIPTAPAIADAYYRLDGQRRLTLPLENTPYAKKK